MPEPAVAARVGCYPGSFNPPTIAHLAVAEAAVQAAGLVRIDLVVSRVALGKEDLQVPSLADRVAVLDAVAATRSWLGVAVTDARLIVDIASAYDAVVMGADKWRQVTDPAWYVAAADVAGGGGGGGGGGATANGPVDRVAVEARDAAVDRLPRVLVVPRAGDAPDGVELLIIDAHHGEVSASAVRSGEAIAGSWMLPEAEAFDRRTGAWTDPTRYRPTP